MQLTAPAAPPNEYAALIFCVPCPSMLTIVSRGMEMRSTTPAVSSMRTRVTTSLRLTESPEARVASQDGDVNRLVFALAGADGGQRVQKRGALAFVVYADGGVEGIHPGYQGAGASHDQDQHDHQHAQADLQSAALLLALLHAHEPVVRIAGSSDANALPALRGSRAPPAPPAPCALRGPACALPAAVCIVRRHDEGPTCAATALPAARGEGHRAEVGLFGSLRAFRAGSSKSRLSFAIGLALLACCRAFAQRV